MEFHPLQINFAHVCHKYSARALLLCEHLDPAITVVVRTCACVVPQSRHFVMEDGLQLRFDEPCWTSVDVGLKKGCYFSNLPKLVLGKKLTITMLECRFASLVSDKSRLFLQQSASITGTETKVTVDVI